MKIKPDRSAAENAARLLPKLARRFLKAGRKAARDHTEWSGLHLFRLEAKRFRYTLELFAPLYDSSMDARIAAMKKVQQALGLINDLETTANLAAVSHDEKFQTWLRRRQDEERASFQRVWREEFEEGRPKQFWIEYLESP